MLALNSNLTVEALERRWDEQTSPARFAGSDELMDNIFIASRKEDRVFLIRKASGALDPFATVFRGRILPRGEGSVLKGRFTKRLFDYVLLLALFALDAAVFLQGLLAGEADASLAGWCGGFALVLLLLAVPLRSARRRYRAFLESIVQPQETNQPEQRREAQ